MYCIFCSCCAALFIFTGSSLLTSPTVIKYSLSLVIIFLMQGPFNWSPVCPVFWWKCSSPVICSCLSSPAQWYSPKMWLHSCGLDSPAYVLSLHSCGLDSPAYAVREHPAMENFSSAGEIAKFVTGEILQYWRNGHFYFLYKSFMK